MVTEVIPLAESRAVPPPLPPITSCPIVTAPIVPVAMRSAALAPTPPRIEPRIFTAPIFSRAGNHARACGFTEVGLPLIVTGPISPAGDDPPAIVQNSAQRASPMLIEPIVEFTAASRRIAQVARDDELPKFSGDGTDQARCARGGVVLSQRAHMEGSECRFGIVTASRDDLPEVTAHGDGGEIVRSGLDRANIDDSVSCRRLMRHGDRGDGGSRRERTRRKRRGDVN